MLINDFSILKDLIYNCAQILEVLTAANMVHADLKPDNILVQYNELKTKIQGVKLIDFGSSFPFDEEITITSSTPEYLPPELLTFLIAKNKGKQDVTEMAQKLHSICKPWSFDVWALGVIIVEIITGFPVWMLVKCKCITAKDTPKVGCGVFGVKNRELPKILDT